MPDEIMINLLGKAYFHEDYDLEADTPMAVVAKFTNAEPREYIEIMVNELESIQSADLTESDAKRLWMDEAGSYYDPADDGKTYLDWLHEVVEIAKSRLARDPT